MHPDFSPLSALLGGGLMGLSAVLLMLAFGRIAGVSGIASRLLPPDAHYITQHWPIGYILGLIIAPLLMIAVQGGQPLNINLTDSIPLVLAGGFLVGFGGLLGNGCTSGHGICGLSRLSPRSMASVAIFMVMAIITVFIVRHVIGG